MRENNHIKILIAIGLLFCFLASGLVSGCGEQKSSNDSALADTSKIGKEIAAVTERLKDDPDNSALFKKRAELYYSDNRTKDAVKDIDSALIVNPSDPELWYLRGFYEQRLNNDSLALVFYIKAVELGSENPEAFYEIGKIHLFQYQDLQTAEVWYDSAITMDSLQPIYVFAKGMLYYLKRDMPTAVRLFENSLALDPTFIKSLDMLFEVYLNDYGDEKTALVYNKRILDIDSLHPKGRFNQGVIFSNMASRITDSSGVVQYKVYMKLAITEFTSAVTGDPNFTKAYFNRGYCYYMMDRYEEALSDYSMVLKLDPYNEKAYFMRGAIYEKYGDLGSAMDNYEQALQIDPGFQEALIAKQEVQGGLK